MQFSEVIGQADTKERLMHLVQQNRLSHALLFLGKEGGGGLSIARAMAQFIVCERVSGVKPKKTTSQTTGGASLFGEPKETHESENAPVMPDDVTITDSCGICAACKKAAKLIHPDIHFSYPVIPKKSGDKPISADFINEWREFVVQQPYGNNYDWLQFIKAENKQGNITAYECKDISRKMSLKSFEAGYKILIMWMPEMLGKEGNKLLKLIEEPPPDTLFILVAENESLILPTILSRTQLIKIPLLNEKSIEHALTFNEGVPKKKAAQIASISHGNYHEALLQVAHAEDEWDVLLRDWLNSILRTGPVAQVKWIDDISKIGREKQKQFLINFIHILEIAIRLSIIGKVADDEEDQELDNLSEFALKINKICNVAQQEAIVNELDLAVYYIERNANPKLLFHALSIKLYHIISNKSVILMQ
jgi:DNA polymerase-3 subunit delta'